MTPIHDVLRRAPALMFLLATCGLTACGGGDRDREIADCLAIQRTTYVTGEVSGCLVERYGWKADDAAEVERERLGGAHPDSAARSDSGRIGGPARP